MWAIARKCLTSFSRRSCKARASAGVRAVSGIAHATDACMDACEKMIRYAARLMRESVPAGELVGEPGGSSGYVWEVPHYSLR